VGTNVTPAQVNNLPTPSRNFLDLAQLAPGVQINPDRINGTNKSFASGAQPAEQVNVFVDGASYKNEIISGGIAGQDASRGNPFPRNAVQEFRIITNNFRAEYQKASSAIITAVTKSGTNEWHGNAFADLQNQNFVAIDSFAHAAGAKPSYKRYLTGLSAGGPIIHDRLFFFGSYEGNYQDRQGLTVFGGKPLTFPAAVQPFNNTSHVAAFRENLGFAKITYIPSEKQQLEVSGDIRHENETRGFGNQFGEAITAYSAGENHRNNVYTGRVRHSLFGSGWTNEALVSYQHYLWNQDPFDFNTPQQVSFGEFRVGGGNSAQALTQNRLSLRDDWTNTNFHMGGDHIIKIGGNYDFARYNLNKQLNENPTFVYNSSNNYQTPVQAQYGFGNGDVKQSNNEFGAYAQDTWNPTHRLTIDLGVRWDVETGMFNRSYVTPQAVRDSVTAYASKLFVNVDPNRYFTNGTQRGLFLGGVQPRFGVSYLLDDAGKTSVFASAGIFYDRTNYNATLDETYRRQHPNYFINFSQSGAPNTFKWDTTYFSRAGLNSLVTSGKPPSQEVYLVPNDLRPPESKQVSVGIRHDFNGFNASLAYNGTRSYNGFSFEWANLGLNPATNDCCVSVNIPAYQNVLVGNNSVRTWYDALLLQLQRPYRNVGGYGWGGGVAYTLARAEQEGNDLFSFPQVNAYGNTRHPTLNDRRNQFVINGITDVPYLFGIQLTGLATFASGTPFLKTQFSPLPNNQGNQRTFLGRERASWYKNIDLRLRKDFADFGGNKFGVTGSVFNVLNSQNLGCYDETYANPGKTAGSTVLNTHYGMAGCTISDPRRFQLGLTYDY
ncbi:MAG: TonB-dependent receptor plug domain-containing protein, partial [Gemmatimonadaceae bacterium]